MPTGPEAARAHARNAMRAIRDESSAQGAGTANYNAPTVKKFQQPRVVGPRLFGWPG
jgi:hypothetical protein